MLVNVAIHRLPNNAVVVRHTDQYKYTYIGTVQKSVNIVRNKCIRV